MSRAKRLERVVYIGAYGREYEDEALADKSYDVAEVEEFFAPSYRMTAEEFLAGIAGNDHFREAVHNLSGPPKVSPPPFDDDIPF